MRGLALVGVAVVATLVPAAPAASGPVPDGADGAVTRVERPRTPPSIDRFIPPHRQGSCVLPATSSLAPCPDDPGPPVSCVLPVDLPPGGVVVPDTCQQRDPFPEGRIVPVLPYSMSEE